MSDCTQKCFYENGLNFKCQQCSRCCRFEGGVVRLSQNDLNRLCSWAELTPDQFKKVYCRYETSAEGITYLVLKCLQNGDCIFWENGCQCYPARPTQCSTYPFWIQLLQTKETWAKESHNCPGIGQGSHHTKEEIETELKKYQERIPLTDRD